jgi:sulfite exporter TauE/SafE
MRRASTPGHTVLASLFAALALGFLGSLHCILMCGPLAVAGCRGRRAGTPGAPGYFGGRLVSYAFAGAIFGQLGAHAACTLSLPAIQRVLLLAVGALAIARGIRLLLPRRSAELVRLGRRSEAAPTTTRLLAALLPRRGLALGLATGVLPCGLLASGWALAAAAGHPLGGALVMIAFCLATTPALLVTVVAATPLAALRRAASPAWQGALWCALGIWIGVRPLFEHCAHRGP